MCAATSYCIIPHIQNVCICYSTYMYMGVAQDMQLLSRRLCWQNRHLLSWIPFVDFSWFLHGFDGLSSAMSNFYGLFQCCSLVEVAFELWGEMSIMDRHLVISWFPSMYFCALRFWMVPSILVSCILLLCSWCLINCFFFPSLSVVSSIYPLLVPRKN